MRNRFKTRGKIMTPQERNTIIILIILVVAVNLLIFGVLGYIITDDMRIEGEIYFEEVNDLPENAHIVKLTEEDYQRYPSLRNIPETIKVEAMLYEAFFVRPGYITEKTANRMWEAYGDNRYIEHNGVIYKFRMPIH